jgi:hypothetical protein
MRQKSSRHAEIIRLTRPSYKTMNTVRASFSHCELLCGTCAQMLLWWIAGTSIKSCNGRVPRSPMSDNVAAVASPLLKR